MNRFYRVILSFIFVVSLIITQAHAMSYSKTMEKYVIPENFVYKNGKRINKLTQDIFVNINGHKRENTRFIVRYSFDLDGGEITIPKGCILEFDGGLITNGKVIGNKTIIQAGLLNIFNDVQFSGEFSCSAVYPQWFGAKGDALTDDSKAIQAAIDFAVNGYISKTHWDINETPGYALNVIIPAGVYIVKSPIFLRDYVQVEGEGRAVTKIVNGGINNASLFYAGVFEKGRVDQPVYHGCLKSLSINGGDQKYNARGIYLHAHYYLEDLYIQKCYDGAIYGYECWSTYIHKCHFIYNAFCQNQENLNDLTKYTITLNGRSSGFGANAMNISDCEFIGYKYGNSYHSNCLYANNGNGIKVTNSSFQQFNKVFTLEPIGQSVTVENCYFEGNNVNFTGRMYMVNILNCFFSGIKGGAIVQSDVVRGCNIANNLYSDEKGVIIKPMTNNQEKYFYKENRIYGNFRSGSSLSIDESILSFFNEGANYFIDNLGNTYGIAKRSEVIGSGSYRPQGVPVGYQYFDTKLRKPIWYDGAKWVDASGNPI